MNVVVPPCVTEDVIEVHTAKTPNKISQLIWGRPQGGPLMVPINHIPCLPVQIAEIHEEIQYIILYNVFFFIDFTFLSLLSKPATAPSYHTRIRWGWFIAQDCYYSCRIQIIMKMKNILTDRKKQQQQFNKCCYSESPSTSSWLFVYTLLSSTAACLHSKLRLSVSRDECLYIYIFEVQHTAAAVYCILSGSDGCRGHGA